MSPDHQILSDAFKSAIILMISKTYVNRSMNNRRSIFLLQINGKMLEKIINLRVKSHHELKELLSDPQHSFHSRRGTASATAVAYETAADMQAKGGKA